MSVKSLSNQPSESQRAMLFTAVIVAVAAALYMMCIQPCALSVTQARAELDGLENQQRAMEMDLRGAERVKSRIAAAEAALKPYRAALLTPLLGSWAMRAKSILDPVAKASGLKNNDYNELPVRLLPVPKPMPDQLFARRPIKVTCRGSYATIASFIWRIEKTLPLVSVQSFFIKSQSDADKQQAELVLEWPTKGAVTVPPGTSKPGVKK